MDTTLCCVTFQYHIGVPNKLTTLGLRHTPHVKQLGPGAIVRLTSIYYRVTGNQRLFFSSEEVLVGEKI